MARPRTYDDAFRDQLVDAAGRLLAAEGPHAVTTRRVAAEVGASTGAIYRELGGKEELVRAMYLEGFRRLHQRQAEVDATLPPLERLGALAHAYQDAALASPHLYAVMFDRPVPQFHPAHDDVVAALSTLQQVVDTVADAMRAGALPGPVTTAGDVAVQLWAINHGITSLALAGMLGPDPTLPRKHLDAACRALLIGLAALGPTTTEAT